MFSFMNKNESEPTWQDNVQADFLLGGVPDLVGEISHNGYGSVR